MKELLMDNLLPQNGRHSEPPVAPGKMILVGEDDGEVRGYLELALRCQGYSVKSAVDGNGVLGHLGDDISAVLLDIMMPNKDGFETLQEIRRSRPSLPVIMLSSMSTPANVVQAIKNGATDFLSKPVSHSDLNNAIHRALGTSAIVKRSAVVPAQQGKIFYGFSPAMQEVRDLLPTVAASDVPVLILGETGTGKEAVARQLHAFSPRADRPFVKLNCAAVPTELLESELFGYEKGAFTGALQRKPGLFEMADGGTILLDEIGDMDFKLQAKLLQVLQDHEFRRVGGRETIRVDVRVIAATHRNLEKAIAESNFREDLYYRLNVCVFTVPPLRERIEDIQPLAEFLLRRHNAQGLLELLTADLVAAMEQYEWPGNVRELDNVIRKLITLKEPDSLAKELHFKASRRRGQRESVVSDQALHRAISPKTLEEFSRAMEKAEATTILEALEATRWNRKRAADRLKIDYKALLYKMKKLAIEREDATD